MGGVSIRVCLINTGIQTFLAHGNKLLFTKNDCLPWTEHDKSISEDMQVNRGFATTLAYLRLRSYRYGVRSNVSTTITQWSGGFPFLHTIQSCLPLRIFFCKGSVGITKRQTGNSKSSSSKLSVFTLPSFALLPANTLEKQKISLGQAGKLETKGKIIQSVWHRLTKTSKSSWTSPRLGSASISLNVFRMWARKKSPTETLFMPSRMERLTRKLPG